MADIMNDVTPVTEQEFRTALLEKLASEKIPAITKWLTSIQPEGERNQQIARLVLDHIHYGYIRCQEIFEELFILRSIVEENAQELESIQLGSLRQWIATFEELIWDGLARLMNGSNVNFIFRTFNSELLNVFTHALDAKPDGPAVMVWHELIQLVVKMNGVEGCRDAETVFRPCLAMLAEYEKQH